LDKPTGLNITFTVNTRGPLEMVLRHRIGLVYLPGALPCFEDFGNLPTDLVGADAKVDGKPASEVLDMLIIPGGSLVESGTVNPQVTAEINNMAQSGKFVLGICSGFQVLANQTDVGRLSTIPVTREGMGLLDAEFKPLVCTDRVEASVVDKSFITQTLGATVRGFHCHTYGQIELGPNARPIIVTHAKRLNYKKNPQDLVSGVANKQGNVVGVFIHGLLDKNPTIIESITQSLGIDASELVEIREANAKLLAHIKGEVGVATNIRQAEANHEAPRLLMLTATGSGSGKTFIVTGIAGALKKRGYNVGIIKVGGDIRDAVSSLYLIKEPIKDYSSIKIGESGWTPLEEAVGEASKKYNFLLVEGAMSAFTGLLNENYKRPMSTAEVAAALGASTVVIVGCDKEGIEGALINTLNYVNVLKELGVKVTGVILNKLRVSYISDEIRQIMAKAFQNAGIELIGMVPRLDLEGRGMIPEIEIRYEDFGAQAIDAAEKNIDLDLLAKVATAPAMTQVDYAAFMEKFKTLLTHYNLNASTGGTPPSC
jgi:cobyric acid synthase